MEKSKAERLIVAITVGAVLLIVILVSVWIYQLIKLNVRNKQVAELVDKIEEYNELIEKGKEVYEARSMRWWIEQRARELGYTLKTDVPLD
jgi:lipid A disaccharide synthetase